MSSSLESQSGAGERILSNAFGKDVCCFWLKMLYNPPNFSHITTIEKACRQMPQNQQCQRYQIV